MPPAGKASFFRRVIRCGSYLCGVLLGTAARASLSLCVFGGVVHLVLVLARAETASFVDVPVYLYFAGPYVIVGVLSWWRRDRKWISRLLLTIAVLVSLSGILAASQFRGVETVPPFAVGFVQWIVLGGLTWILTYLADRHRRQAASNRDIACRFVEALCRGALEQVEEMLAGTCRVQTPHGEWDNRDRYVAALRQDPPEQCRHRILSVTEGEDEVAVFVELQRTHETVSSAQLFRIRNKLIVGILFISSAERGAPLVLSAGAE